MRKIQLKQVLIPVILCFVTALVIWSISNISVPSKINEKQSLVIDKNAGQASTKEREASSNKSYDNEPVSASSLRELLNEQGQITSSDAGTLDQKVEKIDEMLSEIDQQLDENNVTQSDQQLLLNEDNNKSIDRINNIRRQLKVN